MSHTPQNDTGTLSRRAAIRLGVSTTAVAFFSAVTAERGTAAVTPLDVKSVRGAIGKVMTASQTRDVRSGTGVRDPRVP